MRRYDLVETIILEKAKIDNSFRNSLELKLTEKLENKNKFISFNIMKTILIISLAIFLLICGGYIGYVLLQDSEDVNNIETDTGEDENQNTGIANPASTNCIDKGGELIIKEGEEGQIGYCLFDDGSECEEWAFFRGECVKGEYK